MSEKEKYWKLDFKGSLYVPTDIDFHPNLWKGTEADFKYILNNYLRGKEDVFKVIGWQSFDTLEEYNEQYPIGGARYPKK